MPYSVLGMPSFLPAAHLLDCVLQIPAILKLSRSSLPPSPRWELPFPHSFPAWFLFYILWLFLITFSHICLLCWIISLFIAQTPVLCSLPGIEKVFNKHLLNENNKNKVNKQSQSYSLPINDKNVCIIKYGHTLY